MKNKIMKILGIALTLAVLIGLLIPAVPASAGIMTWTDTDMPTEITQDTDINVVAFAPDGKTVFIFDNTNEMLSKSENAGVSWLAPDKVGTDLNEEDTIVAMAVSPLYATDNVVIAVSADNIYYSKDGGEEFNVGVDAGESWKGFQDDLGAATVTSLAVSYNWDDTMAIAVGTDAGILMYIGEGWDWVANDNIADNAILAVAFAPDYDTDDQVIAVVDNDTIALWSGTVADDGDINDEDNFENKANFYSDEDLEVPVDDADAAFLAFPSDYDTDNNAIVFVALGGADVYRVDQNYDEADGAATDLRLNKKTANPEIYGLSYTGTAGSGTLAVGLADRIYTSANADTADSGATWDSFDKLPTGQDFIVTFVGETLYAASSNIANNFGSVFAVSPSDYSYFNGLSRMSVNSTSNTGLTLSSYKGIGTSTQYILVNSTPAKTTMLMKSIDSGKTWVEIYADENVGTSNNDNELRSYAVSGNSIYLVGAAGTGDLLISTDGGNTFEENNLRNNISALGLVDANTFFYADGGDIYKSTSDRTPVAELDYTVSAFVILPNFMVVQTYIGSPATPGPLYFSGDSGVTFKELEDLNPVSSTFDVPKRTIYAVEDNTLYSYKVDNDTAWTKGKEIAPRDGTVIKIALKGVAMYAQVNVGADDNEYQMIRSVDFIDEEDSFEPIPDSKAEDVDDLIGTFSTAGGPLDMTNVGTVNTIYKVTALDENVDEGKGLSVKMKQFTDTMVTGPTTIFPSADVQVQTPVKFSWTAVNGGKEKVNYEVEITSNLDSKGKFVGVVGGEETTALSTSNIGLTSGETYYWHVRALGEANKTLSSAWSATIKFVAKLQEVNADDSTWIAPAAGATGVSQTPNFQWASVPRATGYELVIDGGSPIVVSDPVYTLTTPLAYGSTHTWKVRAVAGSIASDWVSGVFTVMASPVTSSTTTAPKFFDANSGQYFDSQAQLDAFQAAWKINHPAPVAPSTPAYIWVIIVIAAILVIAVIVLIARTRRV